VVAADYGKGGSSFEKDNERGEKHSPGGQVRFWKTRGCIARRPTLQLLYETEGRWKRAADANLWGGQEGRKSGDLKGKFRKGPCKKMSRGENSRSVLGQSTEGEDDETWAE